MKRITYCSGKLIPVIEQETLELTAISVLEKIGRNKPYRYLSRVEYLLYACPQEYQLVNGKLYEVVYTKVVEGEDKFEAQQAEDGTINFEIIYKRGSFSFNEALHLAVKKTHQRVSGDNDV